MTTATALPRAAHASASDQTLRIRICAEYQEMPGMRLTITQAARLFNLEPAHCARVLDSLVSAGALSTDGRQFAALNVGSRRA